MGLTPEDAAHLERCLVLAERGARTVAPNPMVGCVVVRDGAVIGEGWHRQPGADHAEAAALSAAGDAAGATAYVSLEPCSHHGRTPPCADALIDAGVARVVIAAPDPSARVNGQGAQRLREAGVSVELAGGQIEARARRQNAAFRTLSRLGRPHVSYKAAVSLDGRTSTAAGESRWISSPESRTFVHELRARAGAVAVGIGTALADDPRLTARDLEPAAERQPLRVVFDRSARLPATSLLASTARELPVLVVCDPKAPGRAQLERLGVETLAAASMQDALEELGKRRISSLLVEGGATLAGGLLRAGLIDRLLLFISPMLLGDGHPLVRGWEADELAAAPRAQYLEARPLGPDILITAELHEP